ncbi:hypothetical protein M758_UG061600 [Ceratodon purpureus]|nr:hypothetical protein M758_UG061600 [Ceratodon purpureus]
MFFMFFICLFRISNLGLMDSDHEIPSVQWPLSFVIFSLRCRTLTCGVVALLYSLAVNKRTQVT